MVVLRRKDADCETASAQVEDEARLVADAPAPPATAARWRRVLFRTLHTRRAHVLLTLVIVLDVLCNLAGLLLALFTCEKRREERPGVANAAESALRYASLALLSLMLLEFLARMAAVGPLKFLRRPWHALDGVVLVTLLSVEAGVSDRQAEQAVGLLVIVRLARLVRLLASLGEYASERNKNASDARVRELETKVEELQAALRAMDKQAAACVV